jgi:hypothetical protein
MNRQNSHKLIGILFLLLTSILLILIPSVSSGSEVINTFLVYEDTPEATSKTVTQGDYVNLYLVAYGHGESLDYEKLELVSTTLIFKEYVVGEQILDYTWFYNKAYTLNTGILNPGTYTLRFTARTLTTQSMEYSDLQLIILEKTIPDTTKPIVDIIYPTSTIYTSQRTNLIFSVSDDNLKSCTYSLNGATPVNVVSLTNGVNTVNGISSVTGTNTWTVTCKDYSGNTGTDSVTFKVTIPTTPSCGDGTCNGNETCSTCPSDCGVCPPPNPTPRCDLTNAHWSVSNTLTGKVVSLIVRGSNCDGKTIDFAIYQGIAAGDVYVANTAISVVSNGVASSTWVAVAPSEYNGDTTPEYYFIANVLGETESDTSGYLLVTIPTTPSCGDGTCNGNETCSTCPSDCGICPDTTKPIVDIIYPTSTIYTSQRTNLIFSVSDDNLKSCTYSLNGATPVNVVSLTNGVNTVNGISSVTGTNTWTVTCKDYSGNTGTDSVTFKVTIPTTPSCGDGTCNGNETCSTCSSDCGVCPTNCTICKDSKPLDDSGYDYLNYLNSLNKKTTIISEEIDSTMNTDEKEKSLLRNNPTLISLILLLGILMLLLVIAIIKVIKRRN